LSGCIPYAKVKIKKCETTLSALLYLTAELFPRSAEKQNWKVFGTEILQVPDCTADITAKEPTLKLPPNLVSLVEMMPGNAPSILVARMSGYGGLEKGYGLGT